MKRKKKLKESDLQKSVLDLLRWHKYLAFKVPSVGIRKPNGSYIPLPQRGISDIIALSPKGIMLALEIKAGHNKLSDAQAKFLEEVNNHFGIGREIRTIDEVIDLIEELEELQNK